MNRNNSQYPTAIPCGCCACSTVYARVSRAAACLVEALYIMWMKISCTFYIKTALVIVSASASHCPLLGEGCPRTRDCLERHLSERVRPHQSMTATRVVTISVSTLGCFFCRCRRSQFYFPTWSTLVRWIPMLTNASPLQQIG